MAVLMILVGRPVGHADGKIGHQRSKEVKARMRSFGKNPQAVGLESDYNLEAGNEHGGKDRGQRYPLLFL